MELLLDKTHILQIDDSKTNVIFDFDLAKNYDALVFITSYSPKKLEDKVLSKQLVEEGIEKFVPVEYRDKNVSWEVFLPIVNLVTLSIDYEDRYLGCAHRHPPEQQHRISEIFSSPGFFKQKASAGHWRAVLNVHAVVSPDTKFKIKVYGLSEGENIDEN